MEDKEMIDGLKHNSRVAFRLLVERYQDLVVTTCYNLLQNRSDAHDMAQEVFIEVYRSIHKFRHDAAISTWLYRIAVNKSLNHLRKYKNRKIFIQQENIHDSQARERNLSEPDFTKPYEQEEEYVHRARMLHKAIDMLPANQKTAFTLHKFNNLPYKEIATVMEMSLTAVESLIHRAKKNIQSQWLRIIEKQQ